MDAKSVSWIISIVIEKVRGLLVWTKKREVLFFYEKNDDCEPMETLLYLWKIHIETGSLNPLKLFKGKLGV